MSVTSRRLARRSHVPFSVPLRVTLLANVAVPFSVPLRVTLLANVVVAPGFAETCAKNLCRAGRPLTRRVSGQDATLTRAFRGAVPVHPPDLSDLSGETHGIRYGCCAGVRTVVRIFPRNLRQKPASETCVGIIGRLTTRVFGTAHGLEDLVPAGSRRRSSGSGSTDGKRCTGLLATSILCGSGKAVIERALCLR